MCQELGIYLLKNGPIQCFMDNKSAIALANNPVCHKRTKHIRIKYNWLCQKVAEGLVTLIYVQSEQNIADIFTQGLPYPRFMKLVYRVRGVYDVYAMTDCDSVTRVWDCMYESVVSNTT
jgi:hypothetical protein